MLPSSHEWFLFFFFLACLVGGGENDNMKARSSGTNACWKVLAFFSKRTEIHFLDDRLNPHSLWTCRCHISSDVVTVCGIIPHLTSCIYLDLLCFVIHQPAYRFVGFPVCPHMALLGWHKINSHFWHCIWCSHLLFLFTCTTLYHFLLTCTSLYEAQHVFQVLFKFLD